MPSLKTKVNFTKGWPSKTIVEEVLLPDTGVVIEAGFIGHRKQTDPDVWVLASDLDETNQSLELFIFRNDSDDPDAARTAHDPDEYKQVPFGGVQGISFQNPLEIETIQYAGTPAVGDELVVNADGKLETLGAGANQQVVAVVTKAGYWVGQHNYIRVVPCQRRLTTA